MRRRSGSREGPGRSLAGLEYDWEKSSAQTNRECRIYESISVKRKSFEEAVAKALNPVKLRYPVEGGKAVLYLP